ncbi:MAG: tetratricopeptide repeat protein [Candidatus Omnitrophica bacterium]|nr:tetratricopeptide repeat protein [Candidatus Omnitrophota bacterium]MDD5355477.1 tetratricopeptide repeat protein [Candidatus Omnitrophota bacterium]
MRNLCIWSLCVFTLCIVLFSFVFAEASSISNESSSYRNYLQGLFLDGSGDFEQAKRAYQRAVKLDSNSWNIHYRLGLDYLRTEDYKSAEEEFKKALELKPYTEGVRFLLARVYAANSKYDEAIGEYLGLLERPLVELNEADVRYALAQLYVRKKDWQKAEIECHKVLEKNPSDSNVHFYLGYIYNESAKVDNAIKEFSRAIEIDPNNSLALNCLSYLYAQRGEQLDYALSLVQKALEFDPANGAYLDTMGWVYFKKGDLENALRYLENASVLSKDPEIYEHIGDVYLEMGKSKEARKNWQKSLEIDPQRLSVKDKIDNIRKVK